jgi:hypothetical protein
MFDVRLSCQLHRFIHYSFAGLRKLFLKSFARFLVGVRPLTELGLREN